MPTSRGPNRPGPGRKPGSGRSAARTGSARSTRAPRSATERAGQRAAARDQRKPDPVTDQATEPEQTRSEAPRSEAPGEGDQQSEKKTHQSEKKTGSKKAAAQQRRDAHEGAVARRKASLTTRAIALAVVLLVLTISYASSLRVYVNQRHDLAETRAKIAASEQNIERLGDEIARWNDPEYVKTQARIRFGWVMPGETGYRVVDDNGKPIVGGAEIVAEEGDGEPKPTWYQKMWGSVEAADKPAPAEPKPSEKPTITEDTEPSDESGG